MAGPTSPLFTPYPPMNSPAMSQSVRRPPHPTRAPDPNRDSNALRASVLDAAIALGIGTSRTVENWMFNDPLMEADEEEDAAPSPALTYADTATSEESSPSAFLDSPASKYLSHRQPATALASPPAFDSPYRPSPSLGPPRILPAPAPKHNKLRKVRRTDSHDADGGYLSDATPSAKPSKSKAKKEKTVAAESDYESDRGYISDFTKKKKTKTKRKPGVLPIDGGQGHESDGGYISESSPKKKRSFFRLKSKSSKASGLNDSAGNATPPVPPVPPVPPMPPMPSTPMPLPIAGRFVRSPVPHSLDDRSRSVTPLAAAPRLSDSIESTTEVPASESEEVAYDGFSPTYELTPSSSKTSSEDNMAQPSSSVKRGVRFTPSTRFSHSTAASDDASRATSPPSLRVSPPLISSPMRLGAVSPNRKSSSPSPFLTRPAPSPAPSDYSIVSSSEYIVPSPVSRPLRINTDTSPSPLPSPSRGRFENLPPATPPPSGPLPSLPFEPQIQAPTPVSPQQQTFAFRQAAPPVSFLNRSTSASPMPGSRGASPSPSLFSQSIPQIHRGRESPFPAKPLLPQEESQQIVRHTSLTLAAKRRQRSDDGGPIAITVEDERGWLMPPDDERARSRSPLGRSRTVEIVSQIGDARTVYDPRDKGRSPVVVHAGTEDDDIRSDVAQFFFPPEPSSPSAYTHNTHARDSDSVLLTVPSDAVARDSLYSDSASMYPDSDARTVGGATIDSYYFGGGSRASVWSRASFLDEGKSGDVRERFVQRVGAMMEEDGMPPVPPLPKARTPVPF